MCLHTSSVAFACSYLAQDPTFDGVPAEGASDIPTNVVPVFFFTPLYEEDENHVPGEFSIETESGQSVPTTTRLAGLQWFEIVPARPLEPNTRYRIRGSWRRRDEPKLFATQLQFTTGAGPFAGQAAAPVATLHNLDWQPLAQTSCDPELQRTCVALQEDAIVESVYIDGFGQAVDSWKTLERSSFYATALTPELMQGTNFRCIRLRTRAINGTFSEPVTHCGADAPVYHVAIQQSVECTSKGLAWGDGARVQVSGQGATPATAGSTGAFAGSAAVTSSRQLAMSGSAPSQAHGCSALPGQQPPEPRRPALLMLFVLGCACLFRQRLRA